MTTIAILIGGPSGGKRFRIDSNVPWLRVPRPVDMPLTVTAEEAIPSVVSVTTDIYTARHLRCGDRELFIYVHEPLSDFDAQVELLNGYCPRSAYEYTS